MLGILSFGKLLSRLPAQIYANRYRKFFSSASESQKRQNRLRRPCTRLRYREFELRGLKATKNLTQGTSEFFCQEHSCNGKQHKHRCRQPPTLRLLLDSQSPEVQRASQFLLAIAMHEAGKFELVSVQRLMADGTAHSAVQARCSAWCGQR
jgi:hypothetical protein